MIKLFVGLGNPGAEYQATRHNAGFWWLDAVANQLKVALPYDKAFQAQVGRASVNGHTLWLLKPQTFMNLSGRSVSALARFYKIAPEEILVAHDELDVQPGTGIRGCIQGGRTRGSCRRRRCWCRRYASRCQGRSGCEDCRGTCSQGGPGRQGSCQEVATIGSPIAPAHGPPTRAVFVGASAP